MPGSQDGDFRTRTCVLLRLSALAGVALTLSAAWPSRAAAPVPETVAFCDAVWPLTATTLECYRGWKVPDEPMDLEPLRRLPHLTVLRLESGELEFILNLPIRDLAPLSALKELEVLSLEHATLGVGAAKGDVSALASLTRLERLRLHASHVRDVSPLANLVRLEHLDLSLTGVSDIAPLAALRRLKHLDLTGTRVRDLRPLAALTHLASLGLRVGAVDAGQIEALQRALPALRIFEGSKD
jgi:hypothetical protein